MILISAIVRTIRRWNDPVCQDWGATMFGKYEGHTVLMCPVADETNPNRIADWIPSPAMVEEIRSRKASCAEPELPSTPATGPAFNPAAVGGL